MKGIIKLIFVTEVTEGTWVIDKNNRIGEVSIILSNFIDKVLVNGLHQTKKELNQLVIEYRDVKVKQLPKPIKQLPILHSQWQEILDKNLINKEVKFGINQFEKGDFANIILPLKEENWKILKFRTLVAKIKHQAEFIINEQKYGCEYTQNIVNDCKELLELEDIFKVPEKL